MVLDTSTEKLKATQLQVQLEVTFLPKLKLRLLIRAIAHEAYKCVYCTSQVKLSSITMFCFDVSGTNP